MAKLFILDSGAFSVWSHQARRKDGEEAVKIDLEGYIRFCLRYPNLSYYVNLDVIPGIPGRRGKSLSPASVEEACLAGYKNYRRMIKAGVPVDRLIPVFHQNDHPRWLGIYLEKSPYVGISPANDRTTEQKIRWMDGLRKHLFDGAGRPVVKTHGFAVTSYELMKAWEWHSVDSASWKLAAAWGAVYVPRTTGGAWDFSKPPLQYVVSPHTLSKQKRGFHCDAMPENGHQCDAIKAFLREAGTCLGKFRRETYRKDEVVKLDKGTKDFWIDRKNNVAGVTEVVGVKTSFEERARVNAHFVARANKVLPVKHIYFAGATMPYPLEWELKKRLLSFHELAKVRGDSKHVVEHHRILTEAKARVH